ncbi:MAG: hypothetical protein CL527_00985 [Aequorivita sp.]|uniref:Uncharacterized protein n=1 Tax=Aequorivita vladivostokensis TaxID=171194 RepID=A0ABR5DHL2_9FLAO|nr:hypothetical protein MB09_09400 [Aequorivita vladivostokensis]MAB57772.1 hypothetical protein [Aequorivita sp.]MAO47301.1 hypothetical protein [Aequorivita sp.]
MAKVDVYKFQIPNSKPACRASGWQVPNSKFQIPNPKSRIPNYQIKLPNSQSSVKGLCNSPLNF